MCLAIPGKVVSISDKEDLMLTGRIDFGGIIKEINLAFVPEVRIDDYVLVHAGFAIGIVNEEQASQTISDINQIFGGEEQI